MNSMNSYLKKVVKRELGFTLVEVMVVVGILAVIATIILYGVSRAKTNVDDKSLMQDFNELKVGLDQYKATCKTYPVALTSGTNNSLSTAGTGCANTFGETMSHLSEIDVANKFKYIALARNSSPSYCSGYWIAVELDPSNGQLSNDENVTPAEINSFLLSQGGITGGWIHCSGNNVQPPLNGTNSYYGQKSGGVI